MGLKKENRLRKSKYFDGVYRKGKRIRGRLFISFILENEDGKRRAGVVASKKVGGAVKRNRAKRLLREVFRKYKGKYKLAVDVVMIARKAIIGASYEDVEKEYLQAMRGMLEE